MRNGRDSTRIPASLIRAAEEVLRRHSGLARTRDFEEAGIGRWRLSDLITVGLIERVRHGLYRAMDMPATTDMELVQACTSVPHGVVFLASALIHYGLTTFSPGRIWLAVEQKDRVVLPEAPPIELHFLSRPYHQMGVDVLNTRGGQIGYTTGRRHSVTVCASETRSDSTSGWNLSGTTLAIAARPGTSF